MGVPFPLLRLRGKAPRAPAAVLAAVASVLLAQSAHAQKVSATYTTGGGFFNYNFTVQNTLTVPLVDVTVNYPTTFGTGTNLSAPSGFNIAFDGSGQGTGTNLATVDFLSDSQEFVVGSTIRNFMFTSNKLLAGASFVAYDESLNTYNGTISATATPEPGALGLLAFGMTPVIALVSIRRRFAASASPKG